MIRVPDQTLATNQLAKVWRGLPVFSMTSLFLALLMVFNHWGLNPVGALVGWWSALAFLNSIMLLLWFRHPHPLSDNYPVQNVVSRTTLLLLAQAFLWPLFLLIDPSPSASDLFVVVGIAALSSLLLVARLDWQLAYTLPLWIICAVTLIQTRLSLEALGLSLALLITQLFGYQGYRFLTRNLKTQATLSDLRQSIEAQAEQQTQNLQHRESQLQLAMEAANTGIWDWDLNSNHMTVKDDPLKLDESKAHDVNELRKLIHPSDLPRLRKELRRHLKGRTDLFQTRYRVKHGSHWIWVEDTGRAIDHDANGRVIRMVGTRRDVSADMLREQDLNLAASLFNHSEDAVFVMSPDFVIRAVNPTYCRIMEASRDELINKPFSNISASPQVHHILQSLEQKSKWQGELQEKRYSGQPFPFKCRINPIYDKQGLLAHYIAIGSDLTLVRKSQDTIDYLSNYDKLTGLANRSHFHQILRQRLNEPDTVPDTLAVIVINLDRFQSINDSLGYEVGDQLLQDVGARLNNLPVPANFVARLGGDEFAILADFAHDQDQLLMLLETILAEVSRPFLIEEHELIVTCSIGVATLADSNRSQLLKQATLALNQARYQGGNNYQLYKKSFQKAQFDRVMLEKAIRKAIEKGEFSVHYQPQLNLKEGTIESVEALVRWHHATLGSIEPDQFIPLAEETGLINEIGQQVLLQACAEAATWRQRGFGNIHVSVNLSSHQLRRDNLYDIIAEVLTKTDLPANLLELELTESVLMDNIDHSLNTLNRLHAYGVKLALDDFGTGYSSLSYLQKLPLDVLKIDQSFIQDIEQNGEDSAIIKAIIAMGNSMNLKVVAEGVESKEQLQFLEKNGCQYAQGYLVSEALPASDMLSLLRHYNYRPSADAGRDQVH